MVLLERFHQQVATILHLGEPKLNMQQFPEDNQLEISEEFNPNQYYLDWILNIIEQ